MGEYEKGLGLKQQAVKLADDNGYGLRTTAITTLCNLGYSYDALGRWDDAIETNQLCIERRSKRLGVNHPTLIAARQNLATSYIAIAEFEIASQILSEVILAAETQLPEKSIERLAAELNYARVQILTGQAQDTLESIPSILKRMEDSIGKGSPPVARVKSILGKSYLSTGQIDLGLGQLREAYDILKASPYWERRGHPWISDVSFWRAEAEYASENTTTSLQLALQSLTMRKAEKNVASWRIEEVEDLIAEIDAVK